MLQEWGFAGIEPGGGGLKDRVKEFKDALKGSEILRERDLRGLQRRTDVR